MNPASSFDMGCSGTTLPFKKRADESDETTSHLTRLSKNDSQVIGYAHSKKRRRAAALQIPGYLPPKNWNIATRPLNMSATKIRLLASVQTPAGR